MGKISDFGVNIRSEKHLMATLAAAKPDLDAHRKAMLEEFPAVVNGLVSIIGRKLTAYVASVKDARAIDRWLQNGSPQKDVERRIRTAYHVALMLAGFDSSAVVQAWMIGLNPELDDQVPICLLKDGNLESDGKRVLNAARAFVSGG